MVGDYRFNVLYSSRSLQGKSQNSSPALDLDFRSLVEDATLKATTSTLGGDEAVHPAVRWLLAELLVPTEEPYLVEAIEALKINLSSRGETIAMES